MTRQLHAGTGYQAAPGLGQTEAGLHGGDADIAVDGDFEPRGQAVAVDGGDDWLAAVREFVEGSPRPTPAAGVGQHSALVTLCRFLEIHAGRKRPSLSADNRNEQV